MTYRMTITIEQGTEIDTYIDLRTEDTLEATRNWWRAQAPQGTTVLINVEPA